jgi:DNA-binding MarR family transcriptional regulator
LGQALAAAAERLLRTGFDLSFTEYLVLYGVRNKKLSSQAELAGLVGIGVAGISRVVARLASRGLLAVRENPKNRRCSLLALTPKGERLVRRASQHLEGRFAKSVASAVSRADIAVFELVLNVILSKLEPKL